VRIQFWGTRGSIATPGPATARYGGNTSCVEVRSARGTLVVIDCGTGARPLGRKLMSGGANGLRGKLLISHTHWDHIQGIPFFEPLFARGAEWDIFGPKGLGASHDLGASQSLGASLREALAGQMRYDYFPVTLDEFSARIRFHDLVEGSFELDDIKVSTRYLNHPALTLAYRLEADGVTVVYACDHEPHSRTVAFGERELTEQDRRHAEFVEGADLLIHDAQYTAEEYSEKIGWGHSPVEYAVNLSRYARVKRLALTHHDPLRDDGAIDRIIATIRQHASSPDIFAAFEGQVVELGESQGKRPARRWREFDAQTPVGPELGGRSVLLGVADAESSAVLCEALRAEGISSQTLSNLNAAGTLIAKERPVLAILEHTPPRINGMDTCREIRRQTKDDEHRLPILMVAEQEDQHGGDAAGIADWMIKPFTVACARAKISAWLLRTACQSIQTGISAGKEHVPRAMEVHADPANAFDGTTALCPLLEKGADGQPSETVSRSDKSDLLWMYGREIASFDTPAFSSKVAEIIVRAATGHQRMKPSTTPPRLAGQGA
jgi:phosphoribosyl 1,2-cyclic phosphodiesterase/CheY-like chemotaxis protein